MQFGIEIAVATFEESDTPDSGPFASAASGATTLATWTAPSPTLTIPLAPMSEVIEVLVFNQEAGPILAGAIELVRPANKDRAVHRDGFVSKCAVYVQQGVGLIIVDVVTGRSADLHADLLERLQSPSPASRSAELYAVAYRPVSREGQPSLDIREEPLALGRPRPTLPLWLRGGICLPVDLDASYDRTCNEQRIPTVEV